MKREDPVAERRCILTGTVRDAAELIRFVAGPDGSLVPDLHGALPGRGFWVSCDRARLEAAVAGGGLVKGAAHSLKETVRRDAAAPDLAERIDRLMAKDVLSLLGLECRAGRVVSGFEKVREALKKGGVAILFEARDAAADGRRKIGGIAAATDVKVAGLFSRDELSLALGRENVVHAAVKAGGAAKRLGFLTDRLALYRGAGMEGEETV